jgi:hypothetical protein
MKARLHAHASMHSSRTHASMHAPQALDGQTAAAGGEDGGEAAAVDEYMRKAEVMGMDAQSRWVGWRLAVGGWQLAGVGCGFGWVVVQVC